MIASSYREVLGFRDWEEGDVVGCYVFCQDALYACGD